MKNKVFHGIWMPIFLLAIWVIGCGSDNPIINNDLQYNAASIEQYKARQNEIVLVDLGTLTRIAEEITASKPNLSEKELRAKLFDELVELKELGKEDVSAGPSIPGYGYQLTWDEFWLLLAYPQYISSTNKASGDAIGEAERQWPGSQTDTKADAFRHAYWNILLAKRIALWWAIAFTDAHESETPDGLVKEMDLHNNKVGQDIYIKYSSYSEQQLSGKVKSYSYKKVSSISQIQSTSALVHII